MPQFVFAWAAWLRRRLPWSNSRRAWAERLAGAALLAGGAALIAFGDSLGLAQRVVLWGLLLVVGAGLLRRGWVQLFGPVLFYELLRLGRRGRYVAVRCLYAFVLLLFLLLVYAVWQDAVHIMQGEMAPRDLAEFAAAFFYTFAAMQLGVVTLLTPAYTAGVLAEEKERGTLEALLATDLRSREIVLGLFLARIANLTLLVLAGLPVLSFLQLLGGVDPNLVVTAFVAAGCTMISAASVSFLSSLYARRSRDAVVRSYLLTLGYLAVSGLSWILLLPQLELANFPSTENWYSPVTVDDVVHGFNAGNFISAVVLVVQGVHMGKALDGLLWDAVTNYAWFHGAIALGCCTWAVVRLRPKALEQLVGDGDRRARTGRVRLGLVRLRDRPMLWKEVGAEAGGRRGPVGLFLNGCLLALVAVPVLHVVYYYGRLWPGDPSNHRLTDLINLWVRGASVVLGSLLLLQVAMRAAGSVSGERGRQTLDAVLATPLANREILAAKWLGCILGPRRPWLGLAIVWGIGLAAGAVHPLAPVGFVLAWLVYAAFAASLGLWSSAANRSTHLSSFWTLFFLGAAVLASWLAAFDITPWMSSVEALGLSPPLALGLLIFSPGDVRTWAEPKSEWSFNGILLGLAVWGTGAAVLWGLARIRFRVVTGREARLIGRAPDGTPLPVVPPPAGGQPVVAAPVPGKVKAEPAGRPEEAVPLRTRLRPWLRLAVRTVLVLLPLGLVLGEYVHLHHTADRDLRDALAEADRLDPGWRLAELEARREMVPAEENSALQVLKAHEMLQRAGEWWKNDPDLAFDKLTPERELNAKQTAALHEGLTKAGAALLEARRLAEMPWGRFPLREAKDGSVDLAGNLYFSYSQGDQVFAVAKLLGRDVELRAQVGDADGALVSCRALLNAGRAIGDEPQIYSQRIRLSQQHEAVLKLERALAQGEPTEASLEPLQRLLTDEERHPLVLIGLRGERGQGDRILQAMHEGGRHPHLFEVRRVAAPVAPLPEGDELRLISAGSLKGQRAALLQQYNALVEAAKTSPTQLDAQLQVLATQLGPNPPEVLRWFMPAVYQIQMNHTRTRALMRSAVVALAAERYRRQHGQWPDTLDALVPAFLAEVPRDPYDGKRLRYRRLADGVVIYAVGPDMQDNGGKLDRLRRLGGGVDVGVQLWDVNRRRQLPAPEAAR
jgi:ABC-type transport system involved in multi-copper enzyme maturation permease subunit